MNWQIPTISGIQRMSAGVTLVTAATMLALVSARAGLAALIGGVVMIANLQLLTIIGRAIVALAQGGGAARIGVVLAPFKLLILAFVVYILIVRLRLDPIGFSAGILTQFIAIFIETGRVSLSAPSMRAEGSRI